MIIPTDLSQRELDTIESYLQDAEQSRINGDLKSARDKLSAALRYCPKAIFWRAAILNNIGHVFVSLKRYGEALLNFSEAAAIYGITGDSLGQASQLGNMGSVYRDQDKYDQALEYYHKAIAILENEDRLKDLADQYGNLAYIFAMKGNSDEAVRWYQKSLCIYNQTGENEKVDMTRRNIEALFQHAKSLE